MDNKIRNIILAVVFCVIVLIVIIIISKSMKEVKPVNKYRYVRVWRKRNPLVSHLENNDGDYKSHYINLAEIEVISGKTNVALNKTVIASSEYSPLLNFTNGNMTDMAHTKDDDIEWLLVDLGDLFHIDKVRLHNRQDCCQQRAQDLIIQLSANENMSDMIESNLITKEQAPKMTFTWVPSNKTITAE